MEFRVGETYHIYRGFRRKYKIHIVAIVDGGMVVYKFYGKHKQWWHYEIVNRIALERYVTVFKEVEK